MKKYLSFALVLVLTAALFTGCGCTRQDAKYTTAPTVMTTPTILPTMEETTAPTTETHTQPTADHGNGPLDSTTSGTEATDGTSENHSRRAEPTMN